MKKRQYDHDYFNNWRDNYSRESNKMYIWPQIVYETLNFNIVGLVFETNRARKDFIKWPSLQGMTLGYSFINLDFDGVPLNIKDLEVFINQVSSSTNAIKGFSLNYYPNSFEDIVRSKLSPLNLSCVDIDILEYGVLDDGYKYVGIEGTHFIVPIRENNVRKLLESLFIKRFLKKKAHQLNIQKAFMSKLDGSLYLLIYNIEASNADNFVLSEKGNSVLIEVSCEFLEMIRKYQDSIDKVEQQVILNQLLDISVCGLRPFQSNYDTILSLVGKSSKIKI